MKLTKDIKPVTYLKAHTAEVLLQINETHRPMIITQNGEPKAVIQDPESYESMHTALCLMKLLAQGEKDILEGRVIEQDLVFSELFKELKEKK